jgi:GMP synthase-like glutamine amidotransferase
MLLKNERTIKIAILDLNDGAANEGMRCIREMLANFSIANNVKIDSKEFEVRNKEEIPSTDYHIFISSGGPGSPLDSEKSSWESLYFNWIKSIESWNNNPLNQNKKQVFFICHSFQLACRYFQIGNVSKRKSTAFGVFPIHKLEGSKNEKIFAGLKDPFFGVDSRDFQVIEPNEENMQKIGATVLCIEKERPHVPLERAIMGVRFNQYMIGTQFHPEADSTGMSMYLQREDKKQTVIENHGFEKWESMMEQLNDPDKISMTNSQILPNFIRESIKELNFN